LVNRTVKLTNRDRETSPRPPSPFPPGSTRACRGSTPGATFPESLANPPPKGAPHCRACRGFEQAHAIARPRRSRHTGACGTYQRCCLLVARLLNSWDQRSERWRPGDALGPGEAPVPLDPETLLDSGLFGVAAAVVHDLVPHRVQPTGGRPRPTSPGKLQ
jgi:hypothetical protein